MAPLFDAVAVYGASLEVMAGLLETLTVDAERMRAAAAEGYTTATAVADALVRRGIPFRAAHHIVGSLVAQAEGAGIALEQLPDAMIGLALAASGDPAAADARHRPGDRRHAQGRGVARRRPRLVRRRRWHRPDPCRRRARGRASTPG